MTPAEFGDNEKAMIRQIAQEVAATFRAEVVNLIAAAVAGHTATCKVAQRINRLTWVGTGILLALGILGISSLPKLWEFIRTAGAAGP